MSTKSGIAPSLLSLTQRKTADTRAWWPVFQEEAEHFLAGLSLGPNHP